LSRAYVTPLRLDIKPHPNRKYFYLILAVLSLAGIMLVHIPLWLQSSLVLLVLMILYRDYLLQGKCFSLVWQEENNWVLLMDHQSMQAQLCRGSFNSGCLMLLNFRLDNGEYKTLMFLPCEVDADNYRRLRVRFKVEGGKFLVNPPRSPFFKGGG